MSTSNIKPALFIGFGGTGALVLQKIKYSLAHYFKLGDETTENDIPPCFAFVEVDTDSGARVPKDTESVIPLSDGQFIVAQVPGSFADVENEIRKTNLPLWKTILAQKWWWPQGLGNDLAAIWGDKTKDGAFQIRQVGRLALWTKTREFKDLVSGAAKNIISEPTKDIIARKYKNVAFDTGSGIDVFVAASISGGTGCGMLLDGLALINAACAGRKPKTHAFIMTPTCYRTTTDLQNEENRIAVNVNAYATIKELNAFLSRPLDIMEAEYKQQLPDGKYPYKALVDFPYFVTDELEDGTNMGGDYKLAARRIAEFIANAVLALKDDMNAGRAWDSAVAEHSTHLVKSGVPSVPKKFSSFGIKKFAYPFSEMKAFAGYHAAKRLAKELVGDAFATGDRRFVETEVQQLVYGEDLALPTFTVPVPVFSIDDVKSPKRKNLVADAFKLYDNRVAALRAATDALLKSEGTKNILEMLVSQTEANVAKIIKKKGFLLTDAAYYLEALIGALDSTADSNSQELKKLEGQKLAPRDEWRKNYKGVGSVFTLSPRATLEPLVATHARHLGILHQKHACEFTNAVIERFKAKVVNVKAKVDALVAAGKAFRDENQKAERRYFYRQKDTGLLLERFRTKEFFGCSKDDLEELETSIKGEAERKVTILSEQISNVSDSSAFLVWPTEKIATVASDIADDFVADDGFLAKYKAHIGASGIETDKETGKTGYKTYFERLVTSTPTMISAPNEGKVAGRKIYRVLCAFAGRDVENNLDFTLTTDGENALSASFLQTDCVDKYAMVILAVRQGFTADAVDELKAYYNDYLVRDGMPRDTPKAPAHLMENARSWHEFVEREGGIDAAAYVALAKELGLVVRSNLGHTFYFFSKELNPRSKITLDEVKAEDGWFKLTAGLTKSKSPKEVVDFVNRWNSVEEVNTSFETDGELAAKFEQAAVTELCGRFPKNKGQYDLFKAEFERINTPVAFPSTIDSSVKRNQNWN